jgi:hypothetical protein
MKKLIPLLLLIVSISACNISTANITEVMLCDDLKEDTFMCESDKTVFPENVPELFVTTELKNAPGGTEITFTWRYLEDEEPFEIAKVPVDSPDETTTSYPNSALTAPETGIWPKGKYDVIISLDTDNSEPIYKEFVIE